MSLTAAELGATALAWAPSGLLVWVVLLPALAALLNGLIGARLPRAWVALVGCGSIAGALAAATVEVVRLAAAPRGAAARVVVGRWLEVEGLRVDVAWRLDALSAVLLLVILGVGLLIHIYSVGYMAHEGGLGRYFAALNLFVAAMLVLVLADSLPWTFVGWEGVGLASYLLIGFWFDDPKKAAAGKKAFIVNRVGDMGFIGAMMVLWRAGGSLTYATLEGAAQAGQISAAAATAACLLLLLAAAGKSAQLPLYIWLPDAMAGPTPVSALIHAATMVTAGVYVTARCGFLFVAAPVAMLTTAWVGALTALFAASVATVAHDIKRCLAYSTVSQLGLMVMAAGLGAWNVALAHVVTHALFKACLFLAAGSVIHNLAGEQDIRRMGDLARHMPQTAAAFVAGTLAIVGVPPTSGFVTKDGILHAAFGAGSGPYAATFAPTAHALWLVGTLASGLTAFYMSRVTLRVFFGPRRRHLQPPGDATSGMRLTQAVLGLGALVGGALNWPRALGGSERLSRWLAPALADAGVHVVDAPGDNEVALMAFATAVAAVGVLIAWGLYGRGLHPILERLAATPAGFWMHQRLSGAWHVDALVQAAVVRPWLAASRFVLGGVVEARLVDGASRVVERGALGAGFAVALLHNGNIQRYLAIFAVGAALLISIWFSS